jgi:hypothetical protein
MSTKDLSYRYPICSKKTRKWGREIPVMVRSLPKCVSLQRRRADFGCLHIRPLIHSVRPFLDDPCNDQRYERN